MPLAGIHKEAGGSSSTTGLLKRGSGSSRSLAIQKAFVGGEEEESLNEHSGDFIPWPCKKCP